jgi:hypothetical protein
MKDGTSSSNQRLRRINISVQDFQPSTNIPQLTNPITALPIVRLSAHRLGLLKAGYQQDHFSIDIASMLQHSAGLKSTRAYVQADIVIA